MSLDTAATISGVRPGASVVNAAVLAWSDSSQLRKSPTVRCDTGAKAAASWLSMMSRVMLSLSYGISASVRNCLSGVSASTWRAAIRCCAVAAPIPAR